MRKSNILLVRLTKMVIIPIPKGIPERTGTIQWIFSDALQANLTQVSRSFCEIVGKRSSYQNKLTDNVTLPTIAAYNLCSGAGFPSAAILAFAYNVLSKIPKIAIPVRNPGNKPKNASPILLPLKS